MNNKGEVKMESGEIRRKFLDFFKQKGHFIQPSAPLSIDDPELLFTIAGMVPFKKFFLGKSRPPANRLSSCQVCFRTGDLEKVGETSYHHTLFEMLGNFSFGDYFKEEACQWGWEFTTKELELPGERIWITIFKDDEESYEIWKKIGIPSSKIIRKSEEENFWFSGEVGPCGPDSEIFLDRGEKFGCGRENCEPGCDCQRWVEIWNLVFMQFNRDEEGRFSSLPSKNIDTGMGLERVTSILENVGDDYYTDLFCPLMDWLKNFSSSRIKEEKPFRVICDHLRALTFLLGEGILPSNTGRGYVVRRVLRRAFRYGRKLGLEEPFLYKGVPVVTEMMKETYPRLEREKEEITRVIREEEENFQTTLTRGIGILEKLIEESKKRGDKLIPPEDVFKLYDTYGFPIELTEEIAEEEGLRIDKRASEEFLAEQRERGRKKIKVYESISVSENIKATLRDKIEEVKFKGYEKLKLKTTIEGIIKGEELVDKIKEGEEGKLILASTSFYPEGGGQVGDKGRIFNSASQAKVVDTQKIDEGMIIHYIKVLKGEFKERDEITAEVDKRRREALCRAHTTTHLLQASLRGILGETVKQSGSLVDEDRLRFDFTYFSSINKEELERLSFLLNEKVRENLLVDVKEMELDKARERGAIALFEERYKPKVRVVSIGDFSLEVCG
ncbi:MAG: alanine--tRNA ligase, partial [Candidatus Aerophobetes bacterium]|nr:alanine--tRNA ligase [Candidatus Aerophobetes bacterium]